MSRRMDISLGILLVLVVGLGLFAVVKDRALLLQGLYASGRLFGASGLNYCWASSLRGFLKCSSLPLRSPHGWERSLPREEFS